MVYVDVYGASFVGWGELVPLKTVCSKINTYTQLRFSALLSTNTLAPPSKNFPERNPAIYVHSYINPPQQCYCETAKPIDIHTYCA